MKRISMDLIVSSLFFVFGLGMLVVSSRLPFSTNVTNFAGPGTFPVGLTFIIVFFSGILLIKEIFKIKNGTAKYIKIEKRDVIRVLSIIVSSIIYIELLPVVGYLIATIGFTALALWIFGFRQKVPFVVITIVFPIVIMLIFKEFLNIPLP
jgi:putative tricarboxylic transport membrane protein